MRQVYFVHTVMTWCTRVNWCQLVKWWKNLDKRTGKQTTSHTRWQCLNNSATHSENSQTSVAQIAKIFN